MCPLRFRTSHVKHRAPAGFGSPVADEGRLQAVTAGGWHLAAFWIHAGWRGWFPGRKEVNLGVAGTLSGWAFKMECDDRMCRGRWRVSVNDCVL